MPRARTAPGPESPSCAARLRLDAQEGLQILGSRRHSGPGAQEEGEALDLAPGHTPLVGEPSHEEGEGLGVETHPILGQGLPRHPGDIAHLVLVAGDDGAGRGLLRDLSQGGVPAQRARFDQQEGLGVQFPGQEAGQGLHGQLLTRRPLPAQPQAHQPPPAHQGLGGQLALQAGVIPGQVTLGQQGDIEGIVGVLGDLLRQLGGPLPDHAEVPTVDHGRANPGVRPGQEALQVGTAAEDHPVQDPWLARKLDSSTWILRAASCAARAWASCWAMTEA
jgi:hypothetical protein